MLRDSTHVSASGRQSGRSCVQDQRVVDEGYGPLTRARMHLPVLSPERIRSSRNFSRASRTAIEATFRARREENFMGGIDANTAYVAWVILRPSASNRTTLVYGLRGYTQCDNGLLGTRSRRT